MPKIRGPCTLQGCDHPHYGKGYCSKHYQRWKRHGSPEPDDFRCRYDSPEQSFAARTTPSGDCLLWTGSTTRRGYGVTTDHGRRLMAHHYAWEQAGNPPSRTGCSLTTNATSNRAWRSVISGWRLARKTTRTEGVPSRTGRLVIAESPGARGRASGRHHARASTSEPSRT